VRMRKRKWFPCVRSMRAREFTLLISCTFVPHALFRTADKDQKLIVEVKQYERSEHFLGAHKHTSILRTIVDVIGRPDPLPSIAPGVNNSGSMSSSGEEGGVSAGAAGAAGAVSTAETGKAA
jgi:hypothetical protein